MGRFLLGFVLFGLTVTAAAAQTDREAEIEKVRSAVADHGTKKSAVYLLLRSLIPLKGPIMKADAESFVLRFRTNGGKRVVKTIRYAEVMYFESGDKAVNLIPPPATRPHGNWTDINQVYAGTRVFIVLKDARTFEGWSSSATADKLIVLNENAKEIVEFQRADVVAFYGLLGGYGGVKKNASKAAEGMSSGRDQLLGGMLVGAAALFGLIKSDGQPILIYSN